SVTIVTLPRILTALIGLGRFAARPSSLMLRDVDQPPRLRLQRNRSISLVAQPPRLAKGGEYACFDSRFSRTAASRLKTQRPCHYFARIVLVSAGNAAVAVFSPKHLQESDCFGIGLDPFARSVGHIDNSDSGLGHGIDAGTFSNQIQNHCIVSAGGCI